jgi:uncharacterized protein YodC (DUF2158 family)
MNTFTIGDTVRLKTGSSEMLVVHIIGAAKEDQFVFIDRLGYEESDVICEWYVGETRKNEIFKRTTLERVREQKGTIQEDMLKK